MRILIAEDDPKLLKSLVHIFELNHYAVDGVDNGNDAFDFSSSGEYDGLVLDIMMPGMDVAGYKTKSRKARALELLESVGLDEDEANRRVLKLSGGQQQRVAIARALSYDPDIILADEPTGNLDGDTQREIMEIFRDLANSGKCVILVSQSSEVAKMCDECYELIKISGKNRKKQA